MNLPASTPFGVYSVGAGTPRVGVAVGDHVLDLTTALSDPVFSASSLNPFLARGPRAWSAARAAVRELLGSTSPKDVRRRESCMVPLSTVRLHLPIEVADFVDFFSSIEHASNAGRILRPDEEPLKPNWRHLPIGYHGRAGTVVVGGTPVIRPRGQTRDAGTGAIAFGPSARLDVEVELGFIVGVGTEPGHRVRVDEFKDHVFGAVVLIDWSARDIQAWEYVPLGPFLGKSFATTISPWVVPLEDLATAEIAPPAQEPPPLEHLTGAEPFTYDIALELKLNGYTLANPRFASMYWTPAQQLAHMTSNGAALRTGDLYGTGTVSSWEREGYGSLMELSWNGRDPFALPDGTVRTFLRDGDVVTVGARAVSADGGADFGEASGAVLPA